MFGAEVEHLFSSISFCPLTPSSKPSDAAVLFVPCLTSSDLLRPEGRDAGADSPPLLFHFHLYFLFKNIVSVLNCIQRIIYSYICRYLWVV